MGSICRLTASGLGMKFRLLAYCVPLWVCPVIGFLVSPIITVLLIPFCGILALTPYRRSLMPGLPCYAMAVGGMIFIFFACLLAATSFGWKIP